VFYFGHLAGDAGDTRPGATVAAVDARDEAAVRRRLSRNPVTVTNAFDFNKDGLANTSDFTAMRRALHTSLPMFTAPLATQPASSPFSRQLVTTSRATPRRRQTLTDGLASADGVLAR